MRKIVMDFETYFDQTYSLTKMSTIEFVTHEKFDVLGLAVKEEDEPARFLFPGDIPPYLANLDEPIIIGHNLKFDALILYLYYHWLPRHTVDTLDLSYAYDTKGSHGLGNLAKRFGIQAKGDTEQFRGVTSFTVRSNPLIREMLSDYATTDAEITWELYNKLLPYLTCRQREVLFQRQTLEMYIKPQLEVNIGKAQDLLAAMEDVRNKKIQATGMSETDLLMKEKKVVPRLQQLLRESNDTLGTKQGKLGQIPALAKNDGERQRLEQHPDGRVRTLVRGWAAANSSSHLKRVESLINQAKCRHGLLGVPIQYWAAHPGRDGGRHSINLLNLGAHGPLAKVRNVLRAPRGKKLIISDASQIEVRICAWLGDDVELMQTFEEGRSPYCELASHVVGRTITKADEKEYQMGKVGILQCQYGSGVDCVKDTAARWGSPISREEAYDIVNTYRESRTKIIQFWSDLEAAFKQAVRYRATTSVGHLTIGPEDDHVAVVLPSGRWLRYHEPQWKDRTLSWKGGELWGGTLCENVTQATARDVLRDACLACPATPALRVYDEIVLVVDVDTTVDMDVIWNTSPWLDIPIEQEMVEVQEYCKA